MSEVVKMPTSMPVPQPASETAAILAVIERAARDPSVDIDKLQQLLTLRTRIEDRQAERDWHGAMADAQRDMKPVAADSNNPQTRSKYASYAALDKALRPIYTAQGFSLNFNTEPSPNGPDRIMVTCAVAKGGHLRNYQIDMPADGKGAKGGDAMTRTHATGSAVSYGRRYLLLMIFNITIGEADDDGNAAGGTAQSEYITAEQVASLKKLIEDTGGDVKRFCAYAKVESLGDIYANRYDAARAAINSAAEKRKAAAK